MVYLLRLVSHAAAPDPGVLELRYDLFVQAVAEVLDGGRVVVQHYRGTVVRDLALGLRGGGGNRQTDRPDDQTEGNNR